MVAYGKLVTYDARVKVGAGRQTFRVRAVTAKQARERAATHGEVISVKRSTYAR